MATPYTTKDQLDAAWTRLKLWTNLTMPTFWYRLVSLRNRL